MTLAEAATAAQHRLDAINARISVVVQGEGAMRFTVTVDGVYLTAAGGALRRFASHYTAKQAARRWIADNTTKARK